VRSWVGRGVGERRAPRLIPLGEYDWYEAEGSHVTANWVLVGALRTLRLWREAPDLRQALERHQEGCRLDRVGSSAIDRRQETEERSQNVAQPENPVAAQFSLRCLRFRVKVLV
jgi:hypothetical protein